MEITSKMIEYTTKNYRIQIETFKGKTDVTVFDKNNNLVVLFDSIDEAKTLSKEMLEVLKEVETK